MYPRGLPVVDYLNRLWLHALTGRPARLSPGSGAALRAEGAGFASLQTIQAAHTVLIPARGLRQVREHPLSLPHLPLFIVGGGLADDSRTVSLTSKHRVYTD